MAGLTDEVVDLGRSLDRNRRTAGKAAQIALGALVGFSCAAGTVLLAFLQVPTAVLVDLIALVLGLWLIGWVVAPSFTGGPELTGRYFRLHPISRADLTRGLFVVAWRSLPVKVALVAFAVLVPLGVRWGWASALVSLPATVLSVALLIVAARLAAIWFAAVSKSRLGAAISSTVTAGIIVLGQHSWVILIAIIISMETGLPSGVTTALQVLPSSWGLVAVHAAGEGDWGLVIAALAGLGVLTALLYLLWTRVVTAATLRITPVRAPLHRRTPSVGVVRKELLGWVRNPLRVQDLVLSLAYAVGTCTLPLILDFGGALPFMGVTLVLMGVTTGCNLYGAEGTALWMMLLSPDSARADVRGRQTAWLVVYGGLGVALTVVGYLLHPAPELLPWVLAPLLAMLGGGAGLVVYLSIALLIPGTDPHKARYSPAEQGDLTGPAFAAFFLTIGLAAPTAGALTVWQVTGSSVWVWLAAAVALLTGVGLAWGLGALASARLRHRGPELLHRMRSGPVHRAAAAGAPGTMDHVRAAFRGEVLEDEPGLDETGPEVAGEAVAPRQASAYDALTLAEQRWFWTLCTLIPVTLIPQGLVAIGHLLAGSDARIWFLALWVPDPWRWPTAIGFVLLALALAGAALSIYRRGRRRVAEQADPGPAGEPAP
ncbi:hypothetical protein [Ornithinimicrobium faecis]|uniref:hypothetical protein n=1 Tax=Ornithinimicrobium faecis TaxID=2934158 RepID=UPI002117CA0D|nr:hypothetical protein [Ornithinimicrobium sp. HY1745]